MRPLSTASKNGADAWRMAATNPVVSTTSGRATRSLGLLAALSQTTQLCRDSRRHSPANGVCHARLGRSPSGSAVDGSVRLPYRWEQSLEVKKCSHVMESLKRSNHFLTCERHADCISDGC